MIESGGEKNGKVGGYVLPCMALVQGEMDYYLPCMALVQGRDGLLLAMHGVGAGGRWITPCLWSVSSSDSMRYHLLPLFMIYMPAAASVPATIYFV